MNVFFLLFLSLSLFALPVSSETIAQKRESLSQGGNSDAFFADVNRSLFSLRKELESYYQRSSELLKTEASEGDFKDLLGQIQRVKSEIVTLEQQWRDKSVNDAKQGGEGYALWDQEETSLSHLIMEYGAMDYVYVIPPEMASLKLNLHSHLPVPRESWSEVLEIILAHNGIGVKPLNAYARQLYILKQELSYVSHIVSQIEELDFVPSHARIFFVLSPPSEQAKAVFQFLERFADAKQSFVYQIGNKVALVSAKEEIEKMLSIYNAVWDNKGKVVRVVPVSKINVKEMEKILVSFFGETAVDKRPPPFMKSEESLSAFSLTQGGAIVLIGSLAVVDRAEAVIRETENQLQDPCEMTVYLYGCRHSDPAELAQVLDKVYESLLFSAGESKENLDISYASKTIPAGKAVPDGYAPTPPLVIEPAPIRSGVQSQVEIEKGSDHFIPDPKTGTILMVVRRDVLQKIKELLSKLDVPKRMVQIEVLLFEKQLNSNKSMGMNLLKLGTNRNGVVFEGENVYSGKGVFEYLLHQGRTAHFPAINMAFSFLMSQEDIQLNASPSVMTVNQTPATISIQEEISINNGAAPIDTNKGISFEKSYNRAQYGINIVVTPTIHLNQEEEDSGSITLQTNITFDTPKTGPDDRPPVNRRHIENEVRVEDGQTVIIGGLRKKNTQDLEDRIPLLGELPFLGKFFGSTKLIDNNTEMFFFITPTIIRDPKEQMDRLKTEELKKRPGDTPEYLEKLLQAQAKEKKKFFRQGYQMIFGA